MDNFFKPVAKKASAAFASPFAFGAAVALILMWGASGFYFHWSDSHSLFINTVTTIITFLAVFLLQNAENTDTEEIKKKLDEIKDLLSQSRGCGACKTRRS